MNRCSDNITYAKAVQKNLIHFSATKVWFILPACMSLANDGCLIAMVVIQSQVRLVVILLNTCGCNLWLCHLGHFLRTHYPQTCHVGKIRCYIFFTDNGAWSLLYGQRVEGGMWGSSPHMIKLGSSASPKLYSVCPSSACVTADGWVRGYISVLQQWQ